jgi:hypothetical protein
MLLGMLQMENAAAAAYATNPQLPPSLVVFSQAGDTLSDVLTMQRTFNHQVCDIQSILLLIERVQIYVWEACGQFFAYVKNSEKNIENMLLSPSPNIIFSLSFNSQAHCVSV